MRQNGREDHQKRFNSNRRHAQTVARGPPTDSEIRHTAAMMMTTEGAVLNVRAQGCALHATRHHRNQYLLDAIRTGSCNAGRRLLASQTARAMRHRVDCHAEPLPRAQSFQRPHGEQSDSSRRRVYSTAGPVTPARNETILAAKSVHLMDWRARRRERHLVVSEDVADLRALLLPRRRMQLT